MTGVKDLPRRLEPLYDYAVQAVADLSLYEGGIEVSQGSMRWEGEGRIAYGWQHGVRFQFEAESDSRFVLDEVGLCIPTIGVDTRGRIDRTHDVPRDGSYYQSVVGFLLPTTVGTGGTLNRVDFQVVNFPPYVGRPVRGDESSSSDRLELHADPWQVFLDVVPDGRKRFDNLREHGGYAVTLAGRLVASEGDDFESDRAESVLDGLRILLSFAAGDWAPPLLPVGFSSSGERIWERWGHPVSRPWQGRLRWLSTLHPEALVEVFPRFMKLWREDAWNQRLRHLIAFYVEGNGHLPIEVRLVQAQAGLELLAWLKDPTEGLRASHRIRKLLASARVPADLPDGLPALANVARDRDGPWIVTDMRNAVVHPARREEIFGVSHDARREAWLLSMWYLELGILNLLGFRGKYLNRLDPRGEWDVEYPPWVVD